MAHGGKRARAGRPKGSVGGNTLAALALREYIIKRVVKDQKKLVDVLLKKAKDGDMRAMKEIFDRTIGRFDETKIQVEKPQSVLDIFNNLAERNLKYLHQPETKSS